MTRKKVKLAFIVNNSSRKATYKKRKKGFLKKVNEISTLCGINVGVIIYSPYDPNPEVWPDVAGMQQVISNFRRLPETDRQKNMVNQKEFLIQRIEKIEKPLSRQKKENREADFTEVIYQCLLGNMGVSGIHSEDLNDLGYIIEQFLDNLNRRIGILEGSDMEIGESSNAVAAATDPSEPLGTLTLVEGATAPATTVHGVGSSSSSAAAGNQMFHFPQYHQQFYQPHAGLYNQNQFMDMMNPPEYMSYAASQMRFPFMDNTHYYYQAPYHHHQPQQRQMFQGESSSATQKQWCPGESSSAPQQQWYPGESSSAPPPATSGSVTPATTPNPTNNIWFR